MKLDDILDNLEGVRPSGNGWIAQCPAHEDHSPSLTLSEQDGTLLWCCQAGCSQEDVMEKLLELVGEEKNGGSEPEAIYSYTDEEGNELYQALRFPGKKFRYRHLDPFNEKTDGEGFVWSMEGVRRVPYHLPEVVTHIGTIYITEGEKDADRLATEGRTATCNPMGAGKWREEFNEFFAGANVVIVADKDKPGYDHAREVKDNLEDVAANVWVVEAKEGKDVSDHLDAGYAVEDLVPVDLSVNARHYRPLNLFQPAPPVDWVVRDIVVGGEVTLLIADGGSGKSYFALAMSLAVAGGQPFIDCGVTQGRVIYVDEEGSRDLALQRFAELGATETQRANIDYLNFAGVDLIRHPERLLADALLVKPKLIVIDSHAKVTRMGEENSNNEMGRVWDEGILPLARNTGAAVLVIHHTNGFGGARGASQIRNSADQVLTMKKQDDGSQKIYASKPRRMTKELHYKFERTPNGQYEMRPVYDYEPFGG